MIKESKLQKYIINRRVAEKHSREEWLDVQRQHNVKFPSDYIEFIDSYGIGAIDNFLWILSPWTDNDNLNFFVNMKKSMWAYQYLREESPEDFPFELYPATDGLLPFGLTDNGDELYWQNTDDNPNLWKLIIYESRSTVYYEYNLSFTDFLVGLFVGGISCEILPDEWPRYKRVIFIPCLDAVEEEKQKLTTLLKKELDMNIEKNEEILKNTCKLRNEYEVELFEKAIEEICSTQRAEYVLNLCSGFDDDTEDEEVMFGLVHAVEELGGDDGLYWTAMGLERMWRNKEWCKILLYRILNSDEDRIKYPEVINRLPWRERDRNISLLADILHEDKEMFADKIDEVLKDCSVVYQINKYPNGEIMVIYDRNGAVWNGKLDTIYESDNGLDDGESGYEEYHACLFKVIDVIKPGKNSIKVNDWVEISRLNPPEQIFDSKGLQIWGQSRGDRQC
ncbi:Imm30 family immunity protein [Selenomonas ruminantium]|uniref:SMI1-KNR4 cell-wall n=1 Tax=Selenomonas ruminantium TaxID=971 RepID=A0A1I0V8H4_SELRU|nr:Imm30 family immunity protein [Selenomonas ruminantium]SFA72337.1 SMI1-KNR4 cell-wall [Selenomonas ruminantium]